MITFFFFTVKHIYLPSLKILHQPNGEDLRVPPRRSNIFVQRHVCCTQHGVANKLTKSAHIIRLAYYRLNHGAHHIDSIFDFFFSPAWAPPTRIWFKMFDRLAGNLESSVSFFC